MSRIKKYRITYLSLETKGLKYITVEAKSGGEAVDKAKDTIKDCGQIASVTPESYFN